MDIGCQSVGRNLHDEQSILRPDKMGKDVVTKAECQIVRDATQYHIEFQYLVATPDDAFADV